MDQPSARVPRSSITDLIARAEADPESDEAHFLAQLKAAISGIEVPALPFRGGTRSPRPELRMIRGGA
jgi:hypothetical protein